MISLDFVSNPYFFTAFSVISTLLALQFLSRRLNKSQRRKKKYHPVGGTIFNQFLNFNRLHHYMTDLAGKYKTYRLLTPFRNEIYTSDPVNVEYILKTNFENFGKGPYNYNRMRDLLGDGIFTVDAKLANKVSEAATSNQILEIQDLLMKSTLDSIFQVAFGTELDTMCGSNEEGKKFADAFDTSSGATLFRYVDVLWGLKKFLNIGSEACLRKNTKILNDFVFKLINARIQQLQTSKDSSNRRGDILSRFLQTDEFELTYLRDIILNFVIAGRDTTAATLSWFIYVLCKHPAVQEKVAQEVKEAMSKTKITSSKEFMSCLTDEALEKMNYLHAAITETLRLYPAVPVDPKMCFSDDTLPDGFRVNKGDTVAYQPYAMGRMKFLWGDDAEEFRPERWLDENNIFKPESPFKFTAFQAGPRICLGKEFAYRQMKIFSAILLGCFCFELNDDKKVVTYKTMINLHIDGGLQVRVFHRHFN
ncbi:hypothetical protein K1719_033533 [Acacia pycnantha]|nr:hypothetical protein K1719_033533 [Acacia pycnantha]